MGLLWLTACEKDDICVEGNTPSMVLTFADALEGDNKNVTNFSLIESGTEIVIRSTATTDSITIPLRLDASAMTLVFRSFTGADATADNPQNNDTITFTYQVREQFVSRACGFVGNYEELDTIRTPSTDDWIQRIEILNPEIRDTNRVHVQIFH